MATLADALHALEAIAPSSLAFPWDKVGRQVGPADGPLTKGVVALDRSLASVRFAQSLGAELLVTHHPLIFEPLSVIDPGTHVGQTVTELVRSGITFVAAHTNWDAAEGGVNCTLANLLGLADLEPFGSGSPTAELKLVFFVPEGSAGEVIDACASAGAGTIGLYRRCAFHTAGTGTYEPQVGARPQTGSVGARESVPELRVEMRVPRSCAEIVKRALSTAHPYEEPAADWYSLEAGVALPMGRVGRLSQPLSYDAFVAQLDHRLETRATAWGDARASIERVAVVGGAADGEWRAAQAAGAQVLVTGEVKQHVALEAAESGFAMVAAGHYATENPGCAALAKRLQELLPSVEWRHFEPAPGLAGRPL